MGNCVPTELGNQKQIKLDQPFDYQYPKYFEISKKPRFSLTNTGKEIGQLSIPEKYTHDSQETQELRKSVPLDIGNERIFIQDDRVQMNSKKYPQTSIGCLMMIFNNKKYMGTAFLIADDLLLTAAHNCYDKQKGIQAQTIYFYPALNGTSSIRYKVIKISYPQQYRLQKSFKQQSKYDFAILTLQQKIGHRYGFFGIDFKSQLKQKQAIIAGYPGTININKQPINLGQCKKLYGKQGPIQVLNKQFIIYTIATSPGQSGGPIYYRNKAIGLHISGQAYHNTGILFTEQILTKINQLVGVSTGVLKTSLQTITQENILQLKHHLFNDLKVINFDNKTIERNALKVLLSLQFDSLQKISLKQTRLNDDDMRELSKNNWKKLKYLHLSFNQITNNGIQYLLTPKFNHLKELYLTNNKITNQGFNKLVKHKWQHLNTLSLSANKISDQGMMSIIRQNLPVLEWIYLSQNEITIKGLNNLIQLRLAHLKKVSIGKQRHNTANNRLTEQQKYIINAQKFYNFNNQRIEISVSH